MLIFGIVILLAAFLAALYTWRHDIRPDIERDRR